VNNFLVYGVNVGQLGTITSQTTVEFTVTLTGALTTDKITGISKPTTQSGLLVGTGRIPSANNLAIPIAMFGAATTTITASETYTVDLFRMAPVAPTLIYAALLTPGSVAANTTAEQTFTVTGLPAGSAVIVNKPSATTGIAIKNARVSAVNTLAIMYENITSAAITPPAETYLVESFQLVSPGANNWCSQPTNVWMNLIIDGYNELQHQNASGGMYKGG